VTSTCWPSWASSRASGPRCCSSPAPSAAPAAPRGEVAAAVPGVRHVEVDAEQHLELVRRLGILKTPTTLVLDRHQAVTERAAGLPRKEHVLAALERAVR
jgi:hypothetical protein